MMTQSLLQQPAPILRAKHYSVRLAQHEREVDAALRLRFQVFNLELGEGLAESQRTGRDHDLFDDICDHLIITDDRDGCIVGTYRLQTAESAACGFYTSREYDLRQLPSQVLADAVELGRACIAREHRTPQVLFLLWRGMISYLVDHGKRYMFGCCSIPGQDPQLGWATLRILEQQGALHPLYRVAPLPTLTCEPADNSATLPQVAIPRLMRAYLRYGAKICSPPAIDRLFGTLDFLVLCDIYDMDAEARDFFGIPADYTIRHASQQRVTMIETSSGRNTCSEH